ncbi:adenosine deaminase [Acidicapsa dinghuensis]|uniref:adenosine deaminase n=1 Tax=Acidicapsa dinghuensis TaxID=2218256 RepID=A0ABW1E993_9BACT|nr:adenosine deaminase [Acidicapsa dinghuensis]
MDMRIAGRIAARCAVVSLLAATAVMAEVPQSAGEARAVRAFETAQKLGTPVLYAFLKAMPKGAELHYHLSGGIYAETFLQDAVKQHLCIDPVTARYAKPPAGSTTLPTEPCPEGTISVAKAVEDQKLYDRLVDALSMRSFVPSDGFTGHDQFFSGNRTNGPSGWTGEWLTEVAVRAADQNELYLEVMTSPDFRKWIALSSQVAWPGDSGEGMDRARLAKMRDELVAAGVLNGIPDGRRQMDEAEATQRQIEQCRTAQPDAACDIKLRYIFTIGRGQPPANVFAQALIGFALCAADPRFVGINIAAPEDGRIAMRDYHLHMQMLDYLHSLYPQVHLSLHAGELAPGLVPPEGLRFHIREAIELGHAERIGHGVDVFYEDDAPGLVKEMAAKHIMVEINLTSNDVILGVKGRDHPLAGYRAMGVPVALNTDDEGNSRIDLTHEYVKGAEEQGLGYLDMKQMARTSFEHAFLPGASLWTQNDVFTHRIAACAASIEANSKPDAKCAAFLRTSEKATEQWELERRFAAFEVNPPMFAR